MMPKELEIQARLQRGLAFCHRECMPDGVQDNTPVMRETGRHQDVVPDEAIHEDSKHAGCIDM